jgi:SAM-dependent methyltransferase
MSDQIWNYTIQYHDLVLRSVSVGCQLALDVGCGTGLVTRKLASRSESVIGIDLEPEILSLARSLTQPESRIQFIEGDVMTYPFVPASFDFISAVATLHHLQLRPALARFRDLLKPGGTLAVIGLYRTETLGDYAAHAIARPISRVLRVVRGCTRLPTRKLAPQQTLADVRGACDALLPGAAIRRLLLFRYSLIWRKG